MDGKYVSADDIKVKDIVSVPLSFVDKETGKETRKMNRPCLVINSNNEYIKCRTITSQTDTKIAKLYGVPLEKGQTSGLNKDSAVLCTKDNEVNLRKKDFPTIKKMGVVSDEEMVSTLKRATMCNRKNIQTRYTVNQNDLSI